MHQCALYNPKYGYMSNLIILLTKFYIYRTKLNTEQVLLKALQSSNTHITSKVAFLTECI